MATVLLVDDAVGNRRVTASLLGYRGHQVIEAGDGAQALVAARSRHPDVIVSDVLMPEVDGYDLVRQLRTDPDPGIATLPVVFYTANYLEPEVRPIAEACGVTAVIVRSADPRTLLDAVDAALDAGPVTVPPPSLDELTDRHLRVVNTKLLEKVRALHDRDELFQIMASSSPVGMLITDTLGSATYVSPRLCELTRLPADQLLDRGWHRLFSPDMVQAADDLAATAAPVAEHRYRSRHRLDDGTTLWLQTHLRPIHSLDDHPAGVIMLIDDVTALIEAQDHAEEETQHRHLEAQLRVTERLESLGQMAGGVAHDFNNILGGILNYLAFVAEAVTEERDHGRLDPDAARTMLEDLDRCTRGGQRAADLTQQLLTFGRREVTQPQLLDLNAFVRDNAPAGTGLPIDSRLELAAHLPQVNADPAQLLRILQSLAGNARDAMPGGGTLTIGTVPVSVDAGNPYQLPSGRYIRLSVADTGTGMSAEVADRAVEPFFTTKPRGQATGLGLAIVHGIVHQHGGGLHITSDTTGGGTTVDVFLPTAAPPGAHEPAPATPPPNAPAAGDRGAETILLVDDEPDIRDVAARILTGAGYRLLIAPDGHRALATAQRHQGTVHLLLTDVVMPGMTGRDLANKLRTTRPETAVLYMSGYAAAIMDDRGDLGEGTAFIGKPFTGTDLLRAVGTALAAVHAPAPEGAT